MASALHQTSSYDDSSIDTKDEKLAPHGVAVNPNLANISEDEEEQAYAIATQKSTLSANTKESWMLYGILVVAFLNAACSGFDGSLIGSINAETQFTSFFNSTTLGAGAGNIIILYNAASTCGTAFGAPIMDKFGRRIGMQSGCLITIAGAFLAAFSQTLPQFKASRFLLGFGIILQTLSAPVYVTEIIPAQWRGRLGGAYNTSYFAGSITATGVAYATSAYTSTWAWRTPFIMQIFCPAVVFIGCFFIPESPRWLASQGRIQEASEIIYKYHGGRDDPVAQLEVFEIQRHVADTAPKTFWQQMRLLYDYRDLFRSKNAIWRTAMVTLLTTASGWTGNTILAYFEPSMFASVGITSIRHKLLLSFASQIVSCSGAIVGSLTNDWINRRTRFVWGSFALAGALSIVCGCSAKISQDKAAKITIGKGLSGAGIFGIFFFGWIFSFVYTPNQSLYCTEVANQEIRGKAISLHALESNIYSIIGTYSTSIALGKLGWKYYLVFVCLDIFFGILWYVFGVEVVGRTIEELDACFNDPFPPRASQRRTKVEKTQSGEVIVVESAVRGQIHTQTTSA